MPTVVVCVRVHARVGEASRARNQACQGASDARWRSAPNLRPLSFSLELSAQFLQLLCFEPQLTLLCRLGSAAGEIRVDAVWDCTRIGMGSMAPNGTRIEGQQKGASQGATPAPFPAT